MLIKNGQTDVTTYFVLRDATTHAPKTDVTVTDIDLYYVEQGAAISAKADVVALAAADSAHGDNKGYHVGNGMYRLDWPDAAFDGGIGKIVELIVVCTGVDTTFLEVQLSAAVDAVAISSDATAADNLEAATDGGTYNVGGGAVVSASVTGAVGSVTGNVGGNVVGSVASVANIAPTGTGLTAIPWNAAWDAEVQSEAQDAITASALATAANLATVAGYIDTEVAAILADTNELQTDLVNGGRLDLLIDAIKAKTDNLPSDPADQSAVEAAITAATSPLATQTSVNDLPTNAELATALGTADDAVLAAIAALNNLSSAGAQSAATAALTAYGAALQASVDDLEGRLTATRAGYLDNLSAGAVATAAALTAVDDYVDTEVAAIKAVTDKLDTTLVLDGAVYDFTAAALAAAPTGGSAPTAVAIRQEMDSNSTQLAAIVADTGTDIPATLANLATASALTTVAGYIDTEVAAILAAVDTEVAAILEDTGTTLPATLANLASTAAVAAVKAILDKLDTALELDGAVYRYTVNALEQAPAGGGGGTADWTTGEKEQIRHRLGVDGDVATPASNVPHLGTVDANVVEISGDATAADNLESYADGTLPFPAHVTTIRR